MKRSMSGILLKKFQRYHEWFKGMEQQQQQQRERIRVRNLSIYGESSRSKGVSLSDCYDYRTTNYLRKLPVIIIIIIWSA